MLWVPGPPQKEGSAARGRLLREQREMDTGERVGTGPVMSKWQEWTGGCARLLPPGTRVRPAAQRSLPRASSEASREGSREDSGEKAASALGRASCPGREWKAAETNGRLGPGRSSASGFDSGSLGASQLGGPEH